MLQMMKTQKTLTMPIKRKMCSMWTIFHLPDFFYAAIVGGVGDQYQVCATGPPPTSSRVPLVHRTPPPTHLQLPAPPSSAPQGEYILPGKYMTFRAHMGACN